MNTSRVCRLLGIGVVGAGLVACGGAQPNERSFVADCATAKAGILEVCPGTNGRLLDPAQQNAEVGTFVVSGTGYEIMVLSQAPPLTASDKHPFPAGGLIFATPASASAPPRAIRSTGTKFRAGTLAGGTKAKAYFKIVDRSAIGTSTVVGYIASVKSATEGDYFVTFYALPSFIAVDCLAEPAAGLTRHWIPVDPAADQDVGGMRVTSPANFSAR